MQLNKLIGLFSKERIETYHNLGFEGDQIVEAYAINLKLSQSLYIPLHNLEVCLRNKINKALTNKYGEEWIEDKGILYPQQTELIIKAKGNLELEKKEATLGRVIASLPLSFWEHLFSTVYEGLWVRCLHKIFETKPKKFTRKIFHKKINLIRKIRNRIAHYECILNYPTQDMFEDITDIINWLDPSLAEWTLEISNFLEVNEKSRKFIKILRHKN